jgi:hypothetical protein
MTDPAANPGATPGVRDIAALIALLDARIDTPFGWRSGNDCAKFADAAIAAQSGASVIGNWRWRSLREARDVIAAEGGLEAAMDRRLSRVPVALAQRGDIAGVADARFGIRLMVVEGATLVGPGSRGLERSPRAEMILAWDVMTAGAR